MLLKRLSIKANFKRNTCGNNTCGNPSAKGFLGWKNRNSLLKSYTNPYYTIYFKSYYQYFLQALTPAPTFTLLVIWLVERR